MLPRAHGVLYGASASAGDESEALQADVMRFVAILALCLMVIFALVQSLPASSESRESVHAGEPESESGREALLAELAAVVGTLQRERAERERLEADAERSASTLVARLAQVETELAETRSEREGSERARREAERAARLRTEELEELREAVRRGSAERAGEGVDTPSPAVVEAPETEPSAEPPVEPAATEVAEDPTESSDAPAEEGFALRFASDAAFYALVSRGAIDVHARIGSESWRLARDGRSMMPSEPPPRFNVMDESTIPAELPGHLRRAGAVGGSVIWSVTLSAATSREIAARMEGESGGVLRIREDGRVDLR